MSQTRKKPTRKCVACREMKEKSELIRIVRQADNTLSVDTTGKANGRGAYICNNPNCIAKAQKIKGIERSLKTSMPPEIYNILKQETHSER